MVVTCSTRVLLNDGLRGGRTTGDAVGDMRSLTCDTGLFLGLICCYGVRNLMAYSLS